MRGCSEGSLSSCMSLRRCEEEAVLSVYTGIVVACIPGCKSVVASVSGDADCMAAVVSFYSDAIVLLQGRLGDALSDLLQVILPLYQSNG